MGEMKQDLPINILVVDDEPEIVDTISLLLKSKCSAETQSAFNCKSAIEKIRNFHFDLVTLDYQLPDGNGLTLLKEIKSLKESPLVVMVTGHGDENTAVEAFKHGASGYVVKDARIGVMLAEEVKSALLKEELRLAEKALIESEGKYRQVFENMTSAVAVYEVVGDAEDFIFTDFNKAGERAEKIDRSELLGRSVLEVFPGVRDFGLFEVLQRVWLTGEPELFPVGLYEDDRIKGWRENYVYKLPDGKLVAIYDDVTDRMVARDALEISESKLWEIAEFAVEGIVSSGPDKRIDYANKKAAELFGFDNPEEMVGLPPEFVYPSPEARQEVMEYLKAEGYAENYESILRRRDRSTFLARLNAVVKTDEDGNVTRATAFISDITEQKRTEEFLVYVLNTLPDAVLLIDKDGRILYTNELMDKLFGSRPPAGSTLHAIRGKLYQSYIAGTDTPYPREKAPIFRALRGETSIVDDVEMEAGGRRTPLEIRGAPIPGPDGDIQWAVAVTRDIAERKYSEAELERKNSELDAYAHAVSHDLKGPLASMTATIDLLERLLGDSADIDAVELIDVLRKNSETAWKRIGDFLKLAESGLKPASVERVEVREVVMNILQVLSPLIEKEKVEIVVDDELGELIASFIQIEQVFSNLVSNAINHNDSDKPKIWISRLHSESEQVKRYLVQDNGPGIPPEELEDIFTPFHRKGKTGATGLGLSIARKTANVYGGDIRVYNENGACFEITLKDYEVPRIASVQADARH
ncbi:MAG: PAS domain S-box protein [Actinobacteria bacterium]|nr:PAS domain S-box protein [Actinomycetota bacterium]